VEGKRPIEVIAANTPQDVMLQFDVGTCVEVGGNPVAWIEANPGRINSLHLKDWAPGGETDKERATGFCLEKAQCRGRRYCAAEKTGGVDTT